MKTCSTCGLAKPLDSFGNRKYKQSIGHRASCRGCERANIKKWSAKNADHVRQYRATNRGRQMAYNATNREKLAQQGIEYRKREAVALARKREQKKKQRAENAHHWRIRNPEKRRAQEHRRKAIKLGAPGSYTADEAIQILKDQDQICANPYCRADLRGGNRALDHVISLSRGGSNSADNLQWLCRPCNARKYVLPYDEWIRREAERSHVREIRAVVLHGEAALPPRSDRQAGDAVHRMGHQKTVRRSARCR